MSFLSGTYENETSLSSTLPLTSASSTASAGSGICGERWCTEPAFDEKTKKELLEIKGNDEEIKDRFYKELEFGTAGLRGVIGMGTNRMNKYTVGKATQGLANYIIEQGTQDKGVAISYDSRRMSDEFSLQILQELFTY